MARRRTPEGDQPQSRPGPDSIEPGGFGPWDFNPLPLMQYQQQVNAYSQEMMRREAQLRMNRDPERYRDLGERMGVRVSQEMSGFGRESVNVSMRFPVEELMRASQQEIARITVEAMTKEVVKAASEKIAVKIVDQLAAKFEKDILREVKELTSELSRSMEEHRAEDNGVSQRIEGHEGFPRIT